MAAALVVPSQIEEGDTFPAITGTGWSASEVVKLECNAEEGYGGLAVTVYLTASGGAITTANVADLAANTNGHVDFKATGQTSGDVVTGRTEVVTVD